MAFRDFVVTEVAVRQARKLGLRGNLRWHIGDMAKRAAQITHPDGNRRFHGFVLEVVDRQVRSIVYVPSLDHEFLQADRIYPQARSCQFCRGRMVRVSYEEHEPCDGSGCGGCEGGLVRVERRCKAARTRDMLMCPQD